MRKNISGQVIGAQLIAKADGTPITAGTTNVYVTGDGGAQGGTGTATHEGNGCWSYLPTQAETNYSHIMFTFVNSNAVNVTIQVYTTGYDPDSLIATVADAVWDEASTGHVDAGKAGLQLWTDIDAILDDTGTSGVGIADGAISNLKFAVAAIDASACAADVVLHRDYKRPVNGERPDRSFEVERRFRGP